MKKTWLNVSKDDPMGPLMYNDKIKSLILEKGILASERMPLEEDPKHSDGIKWGKDITFLHIPSGKISAYSAYARIESSEITIFNGFVQQNANLDKKDIKWMYDEDMGNRKEFGKSISFKTIKDEEEYRRKHNM